MSNKEWQAARATLGPDELEEAEQQRRDVYEGLTEGETLSDVSPAAVLVPAAVSGRRFIHILFVAAQRTGLFVYVGRVWDSRSRAWAITLTLR